MSEWKPKPAKAVDYSKLALSAEEGFVLSRIDGATSLKNLGHVTGMGEGRLRDIVSKLMTEGALEKSELPAAVPAPIEGLLAAAAKPKPAPVVPAMPDLPPVAPPEAERADATEDGDPAADESEGEGEEGSAEDAKELTEEEQTTHRELFETTLHALPEDQRSVMAQQAQEPELTAFCFDPSPKVVKSVMENALTGLIHARLVVTHHHNPAGLEHVVGRSGFLRDGQVQRLLLRNTQLTNALLTRILSPKPLAVIYKVTVDRNIPERTRQGSRNVMRQKFATAPSEERVDLILSTEGRVLGQLAGLSLDSRGVSLMCGRTYNNVMLVQNLARWSATPPALLNHLLKQSLVRNQPQLRNILLQHPNMPAEAKRRG